MRTRNIIAIASLAALAALNGCTNKDQQNYPINVKADKGCQLTISPNKYAASIGVGKRERDLMRHGYEPFEFYFAAGYGSELAPQDDKNFDYEVVDRGFIPEKIEPNHRFFVVYRAIKTP